MKAKLKNTGEIINISEYSLIFLDSCDSYGDPIEVKFNDVEAIYDDNNKNILYNEDSILKDNINWEQRRYEIAKEMLHAIYIDDGNAEREDDSGLPFEFKSLNSCAKEAVRFADALIEELKNKKDMKEQIKDLYISGYSVEEISDETGISETKVFEILEEAKLL